MSSVRSLPSLDYLNECLDLDHDTGVLTWRVRPSHHFKSDFDRKCWNGRTAGKRAGSNNGKGYRGIKIDGVMFREHRVIFALAHGIDDPDRQIDHLNGDPSDNRPINLRLVNQSANQLNRKAPPKNNRHSGVRGVYRHKSRWRAEGTTQGRRHTIGVFDTVDEAQRARAAWERRHIGEGPRLVIRKPGIRIAGGAA